MPLALFDLDNTLVDRRSAFVAWSQQFVRHHGLGVAAVELLTEVDDSGFAPRQAVFDAVRDRYGLAETSDDLIEAYRDSYPSFFEPNPSVNLALERLRSLNWRIGVVTNGPASQLKKLERAGLVDLVDAWCISDEIGVAKPDRRIFEEAVVRCQVAGSISGPRWMVGDTAVPDIQGGRNAGLKTIWLHHDRTWDHTDFQPDEMAASIAEAVDLMVAGSEEPTT